ncbi:hypothetical protein ES705_42703 [subsurface metagenome]
MGNDENGEKQRITVRLGNQDFTVERKRVPFDWLKLDPNNQRISYRLNLLRKEGKGYTDEEIHDLLWSMDAVKDLYQSVLQNGGLIEDPFVKNDGVVVEGNSRTVVIRELHKKFPGDERFANLYVRILPSNATDEQIITLLGEMHIAGKIEWQAYEQAEYVWKMNKEYAKTYDFLAALLRISRSKISQRIAAYEETKIYLAENNDPSGIRRFTHFEELMKKRELRERREKNPEFMKEFRKWVAGDKFPDSRDVRKLSDIIDNPKAFEVFKRNNTQAAEMVLNREDPTRSSDLYFSIEGTTRQLRNIPLAEIKELEAGNEAKLERMVDLYRSLKEVAEIAKISLGD